MAGKDAPKPVCGIVMPISALDGCSEEHWTEVHDILNEAIDVAGFEANLVSNADDVGIIQKRIIQNLYDNPMVICDVSGKNPNVMFELGLRLAFDRPTIIVKDDKTSYTFDTSPIEHLEYPRDLRFTKIVDFKAKLAEKIKNTYQKASNDPQYTTFLKHFGEFKIAKLDQKEVSAQEFMIDELKNLRLAVSRLDKSRYLGRGSDEGFPSKERETLCGLDATKRQLTAIQKEMILRGDVLQAHLTGADGHYHLEVVPSPYVDRHSLQGLMETRLAELTKASETRAKKSRSRKTSTKSSSNGTS